jgi:molecular chaperone GrpE
MSDERRRAVAPGEAGAHREPVRVVDRRRFRPDGELAEERDAGGETRESAAGGADPRDLIPAAQASTPAAQASTPAAQASTLAAQASTLAAQASRIDELSRAYAALLEDNKAFRQRVERERVRVLEAERASLAQALLEATDDLERALAAVSGAEESAGEALPVLAEGVRLSLSALRKRVADLGAERFAVVGLPFDPHVAEAIDTVAVAHADQDGLVLQEIRSGWRIGERVLRPARVRVGRLARA